MKSLYTKLFGPTQGELIEAIFAKAAAIDAECSRLTSLIDLYTALLDKIDHSNDWWSYAQAKQRLHDAATEYNALRVRADRIRQQAEAIIANYQGSAK